MEDVLVLFSDYEYCAQRQEITAFFFQECVVRVMDIFYCGVEPHFLRNTQVSLEIYGDSPHDILPKNREYAMAEIDDWKSLHISQVDERIKNIALMFYAITI